MKRSRLLALVAPLVLLPLALATAVPAAAATVPAAPTGLTGTRTTGSVVALAWVDNATDETSYEVERCALSACAAFVQAIRLPAGTTAFTDPAMDGAMRYRVRAVNATGPSEYSNTVDVGQGFTTGENPTARIVAAPVSGVAPLTVSFDGSGSTGFASQPLLGWTWTFGDGTTATGAQVSHTFTAPGTYVVLLDVQQSPFGVDRTWVPVYVAPRTLVAPSDLAATATSRSRVALTWTLPTSTTTQIAVERCRGAGCSRFTTLRTLPATATSFADTTVASRTSYTYRLRVTDGTGASALSNAFTVTTPR